MAIEAERGCGYRKVGGLYLCGDGFFGACDRLPLPLERCPVCGGGVKVGRALTEIRPLSLWGLHKITDQRGVRMCDCSWGCPICDPSDVPAYIMGVGSQYYSPVSFLAEATLLGISKRIPGIPKNLELGRTVVFLAHLYALQLGELVPLQQSFDSVDSRGTDQPRLLEAEKKKRVWAIFCSFVPRRIERLVWESELTDQLRALYNKRGITPVAVPDGDPDHE